VEAISMNTPETGPINPDSFTARSIAEIEDDWRQKIVKVRDLTVELMPAEAPKITPPDENIARWKKLIDLRIGWSKRPDDEH
jgi:hypothetical protein